MMTSFRYNIAGVHRRTWAAIALFLGVLAIVTLVVFFLAEYFYMQSGQKIVIEDVSIPTTAVLVKEADQQDKTGLGIWITGNLNGPSIISLSCSNERRHTYQTQSGKINLKTVIDCPNDSCIFKYEPAGAETGEITVRYRFVDI